MKNLMSTVPNHHRNNLPKVDLWSHIVLEAAHNTPLGLRPPHPSMETRFRVRSSSPVPMSQTRDQVKKADNLH